MPYIGNNLQVAFESYKAIDDISSSFNGTTKVFNLHVSGVTPTPFPKVPQNCLISVGGVIQEPDELGATGFKFNTSNQIEFSSAPAAGESFFGVILAGSDYVNVGAHFPAGTLGAPSITFDGDEDTGIYRPAANTVAIVSGGTKVAQFPTTGGTSGYVLISDGGGTLSWAEQATGATGAGSDKIFIENGQTVTTNYTIGDSFGAACNAGSFGPITINAGVTVTIPSGENWTIV